MHKLWSFIKNKGGTIICYLLPVMRFDKRQAVFRMQTTFHGSRHSNTFSYLVLIPSFLPSASSKGKMTAHNWFHSSRKKSTKKKKQTTNCHTLSKKFQVAPEDFSPWDTLEEIFLAEVAEVPPRNAECIEVDVSHAELLHHPHHPVEHLVCWPLNWVWKRWMKLQITSSYTARLLYNNFHKSKSTTSRSSYWDQIYMESWWLHLKWWWNGGGWWGDRKGERMIFFRESFYIRSMPDISQT